MKKQKKNDGKGFEVLEKLDTIEKIVGKKEAAFSGTQDVFTEKSSNSKKSTNKGSENERAVRKDIGREK